MRSEGALPPVLLIDDDAISRDVLAMMLEMHGVAVESAEDGPHALSLLETWADRGVSALPRLILMDTQMPGVSGVELVERLRELSTAAIVAISGSEPGNVIREVTDGFLLKPIQAEDVVALLDNGPGTKHTVKAQGEPSRKEGPAKDGAADKPVIDPVVLGKFRVMMPAAAVREIYEAVATDLKTRLETLRHAMNAQNIPEVQRISHAIKGGCGMVGVTIASEAASRLEISNLPVTWPMELAELHDALGALEGMLGGDFPA
jgi:CheY-like chemotaxis protein